MKIGFLLPSVFASEALFPNRIFAPKALAQDTINGLVENGHTVAVFSTPDFESKGKLVPGSIDYKKNNISYFKLRNDQPHERATRTDEVLKRNFELDVTASAYEYARKEKLDVIHSYHDFVFTPHYLERVTQVPTVYTLHDPLPPENTYEYEEFKKFASHRYVSISNSQRNSSLTLDYADTIYHGVRPESFTFQKDPSDYLLFMGRLVPEKGLHTAIAVALALNIRLEIGTRFPDVAHENAYFVSRIKPFLNDPLIGEPGMVNGADKMMLYKQARALMFPIEWEEPFGMVMLEAMACGTPVIAYNRGSVSEVIKDGVSGFIVNPEDSAQNKKDFIIKKTGMEGIKEAVNRIGEIDRVATRKHVEDNFSVKKMVAGYERVYKKVAG